MKELGYKKFSQYVAYLIAKDNDRSDLEPLRDALGSKPLPSRKRPAPKEKRSHLRDVREISISVFGHVPCGVPVESWADQALGSVRVRADQYPAGVFALLAVGDSMDRARLAGGEVGIQDGDLVICQCTDTVKAEPGDIVVALIQGENTIKRLVANALLPESSNSKHKRISPLDGCVIQAIILGKAQGAMLPA